MIGMYCTVTILYTLVDAQKRNVHYGYYMNVIVHISKKKDSQLVIKKKEKMNNNPTDITGVQYIQLYQMKVVEHNKVPLKNYSIAITSRKVYDKIYK